MTDSDYLTTDSAADALGLSPRLLRAWARDGRVPAVRLQGTRRWLIDEKALRRLLAASTSLREARS